VSLLSGELIFGLSLFSGNFSRMLQRTCRPNDFATPVGSDQRSGSAFIAGYWYPACGYDPPNSYYDYDGPIYTYGNFAARWVTISGQ
jgi:hypothetical protein